MVRLLERNYKLSPKAVGPSKVIRQLHGNKFEVHDSLLNSVEIVHCNQFIKTEAFADPSLVHCAQLDKANTAPNVNIFTNTTHEYNLRTRN